MYKRIAAIESLEDKFDVEDEMVDRFGDIPEPARNLIQISYIRLAGRQLCGNNTKGKGSQNEA